MFSIRCAVVAVTFAAISATGFPQGAIDADADGEGANAPAAQNSGTALEHAEKAFGQGQVEEALKYYREALQSQPNSAYIRARIMRLEAATRNKQATATTPAAASSAAPAAAGNDSYSLNIGDESKAPVSGSKTNEGTSTYTASLPNNMQALRQLRQQRVNDPEFRGAWVTRFEWPSPNPQQMQQKILSIMDSAKQIRLNALFFQVRGDATVLYRSPLEPWAKYVNGQDPGFDPLEFAIAEAHKRGIELHAYINPGVVTDVEAGPPDPNHIFRKHCLPTSNPNWLCYQNGRPAPFNEYHWINMNLPEVQTYVRRVVVDLASRYNLDGIHYDRIRFPSRNVSDDPWSKARFANAANPYKLSYNDWQAANITRMLTDIYGAVTAIKPQMKFSASVWGIYDKTKLPGYNWTSSGLQDYHQDSIAWTRAQCMDALVPMIYWDIGGRKPDYDELLADFKNKVHNGRHVYGGQRVFDRLEMLQQAVAGDMIGAEGTCPFTLGKTVETGLTNFYSTVLHPNEVKPPPMPWKVAPTTGVVLVTVKTAQGMPVVDAHVKMASRPDIWLSSADGFCAIIDAAPVASLTLTAQKGNTRGQSAPVPVLAGRASLAEIVLQ